MKVRFAIACSFFLAVAAAGSAISPAEGPFALGADAAMRIAFEKGPSSARLAPYLAIGARMSLPAPGGSLDIRAGGTAGALVGSVLGIEAEALYAWEPAGAWNPRLGAGLGLDWGDYVYASSVPVAPPLTPSLLAGIRIDPLRFRLRSGAFSTLSLRGELSLTGPWTIWRASLELFELDWRL